VIRWRWGEPLDPLREVLAGGGVLAIPTESTYGLGALPDDRRGVAAVYSIKRRPAAKPLPVVIGEVEQLRRLGIDPESEPVRSVAKLWPAPLTAVLPVEGPLPAAAGGRSLAVRMPAHGRLCDLLRRLGDPLTATSANPSGEPPCRDPEAAAALLAGHLSGLVDDGVLPGGPPSTIVAWEGGGWRVLRPGAFPVEGLPGQLTGLRNEVKS
jgi:L-threonylcarbamoyladenylate synthase